LRTLLLAQQSQQRRDSGPIAPSEPGERMGTLYDSELVTKHQYFDLLRRT
jgi:hypothetical protein